MTPTVETTTEYAKAAWATATKDQSLTPLLAALGEAIATAPSTEKDFSPTNHMARFALRIAQKDKVERNSAADGFGKGFPKAISYTRWKGEWHVTNYDLEIVSRFTMWLSRYCDPHANQADTFASRITTALANKRMSQAYVRYYANGGLKRTHCLLLQKMLWEVDTLRGDWVSLHVQGKRPFGDSAREQSIFLCADLPMPWAKTDGSDWDPMTPEQKEQAWDLFDELAFAAPDAAALACQCLPPAPTA